MRSKFLHWIPVFTGMTIMAILFFSFFFPKTTFAATEFVSVVDTGGAGDYSSLSLWENAIDSDLTLASNKVFAGTKTGTIADGASVTGSISLATGTVYHSTATQIYIAVLTGTFQSAEQIQVDGSNYFTTTDAGDSAIAVAKCRATTGAADTTAVTVDGWTTSAANYIKIWTDPSENYRHSGKWDEGKYRLEIPNSVNSGMAIYSNYITVDGLQIFKTTTSWSAKACIHVFGYSGEIKISNNILKFINPSIYSSYGIYDNNTGQASAQVMKIWNNIIYGAIDTDNNSGAGIVLGALSAGFTGGGYVYNNTIYNCYRGIERGGFVTVLKNNIAYNNTDNYYLASGGWDASSTNNLSGPGTDAQIPATNARNGYVVTFADEANQDFHLDSSDTGARNQGIILYDAIDDANLYFTTDIDNNARLDSAGTWDIGADENIAKIYRSVGPSATTAIATGATYGNVEIKPAYVSGSTTNIADYVATFWSDLPTNVGVGDAIQYDDDDDGDIDASDSIVFITKRIDAAHFSVRTASGTAPASTLAPDSNWSVFRAYISLFNAEAGTTENTGIDSDLRNFDTWSNGKDIATGQEQWNISCYANSTTADTTAVTVDGWTTSADSFIKIYTPMRSDEVGTSQRHLGVFSTSYYRLAPTTGIPLTVSDEDVRLEGLQFNSADDDGIYINGATGTAHIQFSQNIIKGNATASKRGLNLSSTGASSAAKIFNNIIYDYTASGTGTGVYWNDADWTPYVYNNTVKDCAIGFDRGNDTAHYAKNNLIDATDAFNGSFTDNDLNNNYNAISENNAGEVAIGTNGRYNQSFTFNDSTNDDFHLGVGDAGARNYGTDLSNDSYLPFNTDIDSVCYGRDAINRVSTGGDDLCYTRPRGTSWDIGADELITRIYRSVGPSEDEVLEAGASNHLNISGSTATFDTALGDDVGVGDALEYDDDNDGDIDANDSIAFISGRTSSTVFTIKTAAGGIPTAPSAADEIHWNINRAYTSLSYAEAGTENTLIDFDLRNFDTGNRDIAVNSEQWNIACYAHGTTADTAGTTIDGWTTAPQNYIKIYTPTLTSEVGTSQRHSGKWDEGKYRLEISMTYDYQMAIKVDDDGIRIDGLQFKITNNDYLATRAIGFWTISASGTGYVSNSIIKAVFTTTNADSVLGITTTSSANGTYYIWNNIIYDLDVSGQNVNTAGITNVGKMYAYNNTLYNNYKGIYRTGGTIVAKNNLVQSCANGYDGNFDASSNYNISNLASDAPSPSYRSNLATTVSFTDTINSDFHLASTDTAARNLGVDLSQDYNLPITNDIDGQGRISNFQYPISNWDIGADESATSIFRSIAPSMSTYLDRGVDESGTDLTISGTTMTLENAAPDNVGVGDVIQYDANNDGAIDAIAFISARASSTSFTVQARDGANPVATTNDQDWQIFRAYTTLDNAEGGVENTANIDDDVDDFDISVSRNDGKDIYASNEQWNIACYANGTTVDTVEVIIYNWTTAPQNYIKIYTPTLTSEVGTSQRHLGKWDGNKYALTVTGTGPLIIYEDYVRVDGLQTSIISSSDNSVSIYVALISTNNEFRISNNIITGSFSGTAYPYGIHLNDVDIVGAMVWNNIIYGFSNNSTGYGILANNPTLLNYFYNNTIINSYRGIYSNSGGLLKNNISYNNIVDYYYGSSNSSNTNNLSKDATAPGAAACPNANCYYRSKTLSFVSTTPGTEDFHLALSDTDAKNKGTQLCSDSYLPFSTDIDGNSRPCSPDTWDIGADEVIQAMININRNVNFGRGVNFNAK